MKRRFWRYSRPLNCAICLCLLLALAWFLRLAYGIPPMRAERLVRLTEKECLRRPGEIMEILDEGNIYSAAVTWSEGEIYTYVLMHDDKSGSRYYGGLPCRDTEQFARDWCVTTSLEKWDVQLGKSTLKQHFYVLVKQPDARVTAGKLTIVGNMDGASRTWVSSAERINPYYLSFRIDQDRGGQIINQMYYALHSGWYLDSPVTAEAEAVFYDADGNEVNRLSFSMVEGRVFGERSEDHGA